MHCRDRSYIHRKRENTHGGSGTRTSGKNRNQGSIGVEDRLTEEDIKSADVVLLATDINVDKGRFAGKPVVDVPISMIMKSPKSVLLSIAKKLGY